MKKITIETNKIYPVCKTAENHIKQGLNKSGTQRCKCKIYGYARVSTREQNLARQLMALDEFGVAGKDIYKDKQSGKDFNRPQYLRLLKKLKSGDLLVIKSIDRLGRNYDDIIEQWRLITKDKRVDIVVLDMPLLDTRERERDLTGAFIADLVLQILSYVSAVEHENIHQRQIEGIAAARANGVEFGRPRKSPPDNYSEVKAEFIAGEISEREATRRLGVCDKTLRRWLAEGL